MKELIKILDILDNLPMIAKIIIAIPMLDIIWVAYRVIRALDEKDTAALVVAIIMFFIPITWIIDIACIVLNGKIWCYHSAK